ncbi:MAG: hypothetical protein AAGD14_17780 [Planctomycetota bacterium]
MDLSDRSDEEIFADAEESLRLYRRFGLYGAVLGLGVGLLIIVSAGPEDFWRTPIPAAALLFGVLSLFFALSLRAMPAVGARGVGVLMFPIFKAAGLDRPAVGGGDELRRHRHLLSEVSRRLRARPDGDAQRAWLGHAPRI